MTEVDPMLPPFAPDIFSEDSGRVILLGGECTACGALSFPYQEICSHDGKPIKRRALGSRGRIYSYTVIHVRPPFGLPSPYVIGAVTLAEVPLRVVMLLDSARLAATEIGSSVVLAAGDIGVDLSGAPCRRPFFTPDEAAR